MENFRSYLFGFLAALIVLPAAYAIELHLYSSYPLSRLPHYSIQQQKIRELEGKYMTLSGQVVKVSANAFSKLAGTSSIVVKFSNVNRVGYKYNYARIYLSQTEVEYLENAEGNAIILEGVISFASSSKTRVGGEMVPALGMNVDRIWR
jgi:hypothetical protein